MATGTAKSSPLETQARGILEWQRSLKTLKLTPVTHFLQCYTSYFFSKQFHQLGGIRIAYGGHSYSSKHRKIWRKHCKGCGGSEYGSRGCDNCFHSSTKQSSQSQNQNEEHRWEILTASLHLQMRIGKVGILKGRAVPGTAPCHLRDETGTDVIWNGMLKDIGEVGRWLSRPT